MHKILIDESLQLGLRTNIISIKYINNNINFLYCESMEHSYQFGTGHRQFIKSLWRKRDDTKIIL